MQVRVGLLTFSNTATVHLYMNGTMNKEDVLRAVAGLPYDNGATHTSEALRVARTVMFTTAAGDRFDVPNYAVIITDGQSTINPEDTLPESVKVNI